jgi:hypothetical protein
MTTPLHQLLAASAMVITLERIASSGVLSDTDEMETRLLIVRACRAFQIPSIAERSNVVELVDHDPEYRIVLGRVGEEMQRS